MNVANLEKLKAWLLAGAPHALFSMMVPLNRTKIAIKEKYFEFNGLATSERDKLGLGDCGTTCCVAGAAVWMNRGFKKIVPRLASFYSWDEISNEALEFLGLSSEGANDPFFLHNLFDPDRAPSRCSPLQAAQAVQNIIDGKNQACWEGVS